MSALPDLLPMEPYLRQMVWGGRRLETLYAKRLPPAARVGEAFEVSAYPDRESVVAAGPLRGRTLGSLVAEYGAALVGGRVWGPCRGRLPLLIKLLDADQDLSVQVHPDDAYVERHRLDGAGKTEAWFVLRSDGGRVACGLQPGTSREDLRRAVQGGRVEDVIRYHGVRAGDVLFLPPGTVHALCGGVVLYEVQQNSDVTFRLYDYGRTESDGRPRELHVEQALDVIDFGAGPVRPRPWQELAGEDASSVVLVDCEHFRLSLHHLSTSGRRHAAGDAFLALTVVEGVARLTGGDNGVECALRAGSTVLVPAQRTLTVTAAEAGGCAYLIASPGLPARSR